MSATLPFAGLELGGTKTICVLGTGPDDVREEVQLPTLRPGETFAAIREVFDRWRAGAGFAAIGISSFGPLDLDSRSPAFGHMAGTPKPNWSGADVLGVAGGYGVPVAIDTDVNGAALAEATWGGFRGLRSYAYVTVGTGLGVGTVVDGRTITGLGHSEAGHMLPPRSNPDWPGCCPYHGACVEGLASGAAIKARNGRTPSQIPPDDPAWDEVVEALTLLFHNLVFTTAPERILVGGGVIEGQTHLLPRIRTALVKSLAGYYSGARASVDIEHYLASPELGVRVGPLGALAKAQAALGQAAI